MWCFGICKNFLLRKLLVDLKTGSLVYVNEKLLTRHTCNQVCMYNLLQVNNQGRTGARARARGSS